MACSIVNQHTPGDYNFKYSNELSNFLFAVKWAVTTVKDMTKFDRWISGSIKKYYSQYDLEEAIIRQLGDMIDALASNPNVTFSGRKNGGWDVKSLEFREIANKYAEDRNVAAKKNIDDVSRSEFMKAVCGGDVDQVEKLLKNKIDTSIVSDILDSRKKLNPKIREMLRDYYIKYSDPLNP